MRFIVLVTRCTVHFDNGIGLRSFRTVTIETGCGRLRQCRKRTGFVGVVTVQQFDGFDNNVRCQTSATVGSFAERRPNGLDFGAPFAEWHLPKEFDVLRRRLESKAGRQGKREYIRILRLLERFSLDQVARGISRALSSNTTAYEGVRLYVECETSVSVELFSLDGRPLLQQVKLPEPDINVYSTLLYSNSYEETRNKTNGIVEASSATAEVAGLRAGLRRGGFSLREGEH